MKNDKPLVSIGMPVYNGEKYIRQALDSLLTQDYENFELIISDNASTDGTQEICLEYAARNPRIRYYRNERNMGAMWNFKRVLDLAYGEYFIWAAHDDVREPDAIKLMLSPFLFNPGIVFVGSHYQTINYVTGEVKQRRVPVLHIENTPFENCVHLLGRPTPSLIYGMFRTNVLKQTQFVSLGGFDFGDVFLLFETSLMGRMHIVSKTLYHCGIVDRTPKPKSFARHKLPGFKFDYSKYYWQSLKFFLRSSFLTCKQSIQLIQLLNQQVVRLMIRYEKEALRKCGIYGLRCTQRLATWTLSLTSYALGNHSDTKHLSTYSEVAADIARHKMLSFYSQFINSDDLCFDIGANLGNRTDVFLALGARVVAVEPQDECNKVLMERYKRRRNVELIAKGAASEEGVVDLWICDESRTIATMSNSWKSAVVDTMRFGSNTWSRKERVPVTTLDALIQQFGVPQFCKIDVEGFEYQVLQGLSQPVPFISFEFTYPERFEEAKSCMDYLCYLGDARFNLAFGESMSLALADWGPPEKIMQEIEACGTQLEFGDIYVRFL